MESSILAMFVFLLLGAVVSHSVLPPELYWKTMLPDVPMPQAVKELLKPGYSGKDASNAAELDPNAFSYHAGKPSEPNVFQYAKKPSEPNVFQYQDGKPSDANVFSYKAVNELLQPGNAGKDASNAAELIPNGFLYNTGKHSDSNAFSYNSGKHSDPNAFSYNAGKRSEPNVFQYHDGKPSNANVFSYKAVNELLQPGNAGKDASNGAKLNPNGFLYNTGKHSDPNAFSYNSGKHSDPNAFSYNAGKRSEPNVFQYHDEKPSDANIFSYKAVNELLQPATAGKDASYGAESKDKVNDYDNLFFLEKQLHPGSKINVHLARSTKGAIFLPRQQAVSIPFSSEMLSEVMGKLSVKPHSMEAKLMEQTIRTCEEPANEGEEKYCATSLESMVDFVVYKLGRNVHSISTEVGKEETSKQVYTTGLGIKRIGGANSIICHNQAYAYPVYYCHATQSTKVYVVPFSTAEGSTTRAIAVCHTDTSKWNPEHLAFEVLKIKPGTIPVCHFLPEGHIVWTSDETFA